MIFDRQGRTRSLAQREHHQTFPRPGWAEQDADEIWRHVQRLVPEALAQAGLDHRQVAALGIANQRETTVVWDRATGRSVAPAITWQDTRTSDIVDDLVAKGATDKVMPKSRAVSSSSRHSGSTDEPARLNRQRRRAHRRSAGTPTSTISTANVMSAVRGAVCDAFEVELAVLSIGLFSSRTDGVLAPGDRPSSVLDDGEPGSANDVADPTPGVGSKLTHPTPSK